MTLLSLLDFLLPSNAESPKPEKLEKVAARIGSEIILHYLSVLSIPKLSSQASTSLLYVVLVPEVPDRAYVRWVAP